jgi:hypothetical protein
MRKLIKISFEHKCVSTRALLANFCPFTDASTVHLGGLGVRGGKKKKVDEFNTV